MKMSIISNYFPPEIGAASSRVFAMAVLLQNTGMDVEVLTALPNHPLGKIFHTYRGKFMVKETVKGIRIRRFWLFASNSSRALPRIVSMLSLSVTIFAALPHLIFRRPRVVIVNSPPLLLGLAGIILSALCGARTVLNISDIWPLSAFEMGAMSKGFLYSRLKGIERFMYRASHGFLGQSNEILEHIRSLQPRKSALLYRNLARVSKFIDNTPSIKQKRMRIIYAGLLGVAQGIADICRNVDFSSLRAEFHIYGDGNERALIEDYIKTHANCHIFIHNTVSPDALLEVLAQFHAMLVPLKSSIRGAMPSKLYTALAAGLPVIFSGSGEGERFVIQYKLGWVSDPVNYNALQKNIEQLANMEEREYRNLRKSISHIAKTQFSIEMQGNDLVNFLRQPPKAHMDADMEKLP